MKVAGIFDHSHVSISESNIYSIWDESRGPNIVMAEKGVHNFPHYSFLILKISVQILVIHAWNAGITKYTDVFF